MGDYAVPERVGLLLEAHASDPLNEHVAGICRLAVAEAYREMAVRFKAIAREWREEHNRTIRASGFGRAVVELCNAANELDPEGATR